MRQRFALQLLLLIFTASAAFSQVDTAKVTYTESTPETADIKIEKFLKDRFPVISDAAVESIKGSRFLYKENDEQGKEVYKIHYLIPKNYLEDTAKIMWELNIPQFQSKIYQVYKNDTVLIDTWRNVVGANSSKTYTGSFAAYKIRNWPPYKDPDPAKKDQPADPPGYKNPLGLFVVHYDENSLRYFHGTNKEHLMEKEDRNLSHGCVRNENGNIEKMKQFIIKRVIKSTNLSAWLPSKKTLVYMFKEEEKFPVTITYKTFDTGKDQFGHYVEFFKDIYNYKNPKNINAKLDDASLVTLTTPENVVTEVKSKFGASMDENQLNTVITNLIDKADYYKRYYLEMEGLTFTGNTNNSGGQETKQVTAPVKQTEVKETKQVTVPVKPTEEVKETKKSETIPQENTGY